MTTAEIEAQKTETCAQCGKNYLLPFGTWIWPHESIDSTDGLCRECVEARQ